MRIRNDLAWVSVLSLLGLPIVATGQSPNNKPANATLLTAALQLQDGVWAYQLATPANARLLTWARLLDADLADVDAPLRAQLKLNDGEGLVVTNVKPDGAGAESGLLLYDVLLGLTDEPKPEAVYPLYVWRQGARMPVTVKTRVDRHGWIGVNLVEIDDAMRSQLSLAAGRGLLVREVTDESPAKQAGLQQHDVIDGWSDGKPSGTVEEFSKVIRISAGKNLGVQILRHGKSLTINVTPQKRPEQAAATNDQAMWQLWRGIAQPQLPTQLDPHGQRLTYLNLLNSNLAARQALAIAAQPGEDKQSKLIHVEKQLEQMLAELQAARKAIEDIRQFEERKREKRADEKK